MIKHLAGILVLLLVSSHCMAGDVTVEWQNVDDHLYDSAGTDMRMESRHFQLVLDMNGDTDVGMMIASNVWAIGAEDADTADYGSDDDVTLSPQNTNWVFNFGSGYVYMYSLYNETLYGSKPFYFRFFNAPQVLGASEAGLIYSTAGEWETPPDALSPTKIVQLGRLEANVAGSTDGVHADGWATMAAPAGPAGAGPSSTFFSLK